VLPLLATWPLCFRNDRGGGLRSVRRRGELRTPLAFDYERDRPAPDLAAERQFQIGTSPLCSVIESLLDLGAAVEKAWLHPAVANEEPVSLIPLVGGRGATDYGASPERRLNNHPSVRDRFPVRREIPPAWCAPD
jgi:hypothetical protein